MESMITRLFATCLLAGSIAPVYADWLGFRGPSGSAVSDDAKPLSSALSIAWTADLPGRGLSAPIIVGDKVFLTCASGPEQATLHVFCFDAGTGKTLWERQMRATGRTMAQEKTCVAAPTPCSDGKYVFALFSSNDLFAFDLDGNLVWLRGLTYDYPNASNSLGMAQSPMIVNGVVVVQSENDSESFAAGLDAQSGRNLWKLDRPKAANWTSPVVLPNGVAALQSSKGVTGVEAKTGKILWNYAEGAATIPSNAVSDGIVYAVSNGITALRPEGDSVSQVWREDGLKPGTASPLVIGDQLYVITSAGILVRASTKDGASSWKLRLKAPFSGSPVAAGSFIYVANERGILQCIDTTVPEGKVVQEVELKDTVLTTPAISGGALFLRSDKKLWRLQ
jgi:outer membrane protein assembly factor BamB